MQVELANQEFSDICGVKCTADKLKKAFQEQQRKAEKKRKDAEALLRKGTAEAKKQAEKLKKEADHLAENAKKVGKSATVKLNQLNGKVKDAYKKLLRKSIVTNAYLMIRANGHGIATKLYPAIISESDAKKMKFKPSFTAKSKVAYSKLLAKWKELGGKESKLNDAIKKGAKLRIAKFNKNPYQSSFSGFDGEFLSVYALPYPNNSSYHSCCGNSYSGIDANNDGVDDETGMPSYMNAPSSETEDISTEEVTNDEADTLAEEGISEPNESDKKSGFQSIIAWIMSLFGGKKSESPYEAGSAEDLQYTADEATDIYSPEDDGTLNDVTDKKESLGNSSNSSNSDEIWGIKKPYFYGGVTVISVLGIIGLVKFLNK